MNATRVSDDSLNRYHGGRADFLATTRGQLDHAQLLLSWAPVGSPECVALQSKIERLQAVIEVNA